MESITLGHVLGGGGHGGGGGSGGCREVCVLDDFLLIKAEGDGVFAWHLMLESIPPGRVLVMAVPK